MNKMEEPLSDLVRKPIEIAAVGDYRRTKDLEWMNHRMEDSHIRLSLARIQKEAESLSTFSKKSGEENNIQDAKVPTREALLGKEIASLENKKTCELLRRHYLRERDPSLKSLMTNLEAAYVCRDLKQQMLNNEYRRLLDRSSELKKDVFLNNSIFNEKLQAAKEEKDEFDRLMAYKKDLIKQKNEKTEQERREQYEEDIKDKKMLEDVMIKVAEENLKLTKHKLEIKEKLRTEMLESLAERRIMREQQKALAEQQEQHYKEQARGMIDRDAMVSANRAEKFEQRQKVNAKIRAEVEAKEAEMKRRAHLVKQLQENEYIEKNVQADIDEKDKVERVKRETKDVLMWQMQYRANSAAKERMLEAEFLKLTEKKMSENDEKERLNQLKKKEKQRLYSLELKQQILDNESRRKREIEADSQRLRNVEEYNGAWLAEVAEERKKILEEHAPHVLGCMTKGVIEPKDLSVVKHGVTQYEHTKDLDVDNMARNRRQSHPKCNVQCFDIRNW